MPVPPLRLCMACAVASLAAALAGCGTLKGAAPSPPPPPVQPRSASPEAPPAPTPAVATTPPGKYATRRGFYVLYTDFEFDRNDALFAQLDALPEQVASELKLPPGNAVVQVFLFDTQERYERFMQKKYPDLPNRRAYFLSQPRPGGMDELKIYTWMGDHLTTDLRHELTHALLRGVLKEVPLWLDEGLAGYFELPPEQNGVNPGHLETLLHSPFKPNLARLEKFTQVAQMEKPEYREAWAWVYLMLRGDPTAKKVLHEYLQALRTNPNPGPLLAKLQQAVPEPEQALVDLLGSVEVSRAKRPN